MVNFSNTFFKYKSEDDKSPTISKLNLDVKAGEVVALTGESGCGKTTIVRLINGLCPNFYEGDIYGNISVNGQNPSTQELFKTAGSVGSIFQNPRTQFFNVDTTSEIIFAAENRGLSKKEIQNRFENVVSSFNIQKLLGRSIFELSGGEKQKIACASVAMMENDIIVMDEPSSNLDLCGIEELRRIIEKWKADGKTIIIAEHRLYYLRELLDRLLIMEDGEIIRSLDADEIRHLSTGQANELGIRSLSMRELLDGPVSQRGEEASGYKIADLSYYYKNSDKGMSVKNLEIPIGQITAVIGLNGSGKTTFAKALCGLLKTKKDIIYIDGKKLSRKNRLLECFMVMQDVNSQLFSESVMGELMLSYKEKADKNFDEKEYIAKAEAILKDLDLYEVRDRHPLSLSGGQKQRVAIADAVAADKRLIVFDEPTSGLDHKHMLEVAGILKKLANMGKAILMITHDMELIKICAGRVITMENGKPIDNYCLQGLNLNLLFEYFNKVTTGHEPVKIYKAEDRNERKEATN